MFLRTLNIYCSHLQSVICFRLSDVQNLVAQLYEVLNVKDHQVKKEVNLYTEMENLRQELLPLEDVSCSTI